MSGNPNLYLLNTNQTMVLRKCSIKLFLLTLLSNIFLLTIDPVISQQYTYYNYRYDLNENSEIDRCHNIVKTVNGYVISGHSIVYGGSTYWWEKVLAKINLEGQVQFIKYYGEDSIDYFFSNYPGYLVIENNHFYAVGKKRTPSLD